MTTCDSCEKKAIFTEQFCPDTDSGPFKHHYCEDHFLNRYPENVLDGGLEIIQRDLDTGKGELWKGYRKPIALLIKKKLPNIYMKYKTLLDKIINEPIS